MAFANVDDPGGSYGRSFPSFMDPRNEFGAVTTLLLTGKDGRNLPIEPFIIAKTIEDAAGPIEDARSEDKGNRYVLRTRKAHQVEKLLKITRLIDGTDVEIKLHPRLNVSRCVISTFDLIHKSEAEIATGLEHQGVIAVRRILRSNKENTPALILTFNKPVYPEVVKVGLTRVTTKPYYPNPLLCFKCFDYGHPRKNCTNPPRCYNCSQGHEAREVCEDEPFCLNCEGGHRPSSRQCGIYKKELEVIRTKIDSNLSYAEARKRVESGNGSYAHAAAQPRLDQARFNALSSQLQEMQNKVVQLEQQLKQKQSVEEKLDQLIEQNRQKEARNSELLELLRVREAKIAKLETQVQNMTSSFECARSEPTESVNSESEQDGNKKKGKRSKHQKQQQKSTGMSPPPAKKSSNTSRSPYMTRRTTSLSSVESVGKADVGKEQTLQFRDPPPDGPSQ